MVSVLTPYWKGPGARLAGVTLLRSCARHFTIIVLYYTQVYKRVPENVLRRKGRGGGGGRGGNPLMDEYPVQGEIETFPVALLQKPGQIVIVWVVLLRLELSSVLCRTITPSVVLFITQHCLKLKTNSMILSYFVFDIFRYFYDFLIASITSFISMLLQKRELFYSCKQSLLCCLIREFKLHVPVY